MTGRAFEVCAAFLILMSCTTSQVEQHPGAKLRLSFVIDKTFDENHLVSIFRSYDPAGLVGRAASMHIDADFARRIRDAATPVKAKELARAFVQDRFREQGTAIEASKTEYEKKWKDLLPILSSVVVGTTESAWIHPHYTCVISSIFPGLSDWRGSTVAAKFDNPAPLKRQMLAHEIVLSDVFQLLRKRYTISEVNDWQVWAFSEITAALILDDPMLEGFWPNLAPERSYSGYPQLPQLAKKLKQLFDHRTSYVAYEEASISALMGFQPLRFRSAWLGVFMHDIQSGDPACRQFAMEMGLTGIKAPMVLGFFKGSPADKAGLMIGDWITAVGSSHVESASDLTRLIGSVAPGSKTAITVLRMGNRVNLSATIGERGEDGSLVQTSNLWPGFTVTELTEELRIERHISKNTQGVVVASIADADSPAAIAGLKTDDLITKVNGNDVSTLTEFYEAFNSKGGRHAEILVLRGNSELVMHL